MNVFEKMLFLKSIIVFQYVKDDLLLEIASTMQEQTVEANEPIITKGEMNTNLYMIVEGKVKVHDDEKFIQELAEHETFGELAAFSPEKRIASVTAIEETLLLKMDSTSIYDLMAIEPEFAKGIILFLCHRMRSMAEDLL